MIENNNLSFSKEVWDNASNYEKSNLISAFFKENEVEGMHCDDIKALLGEPDVETHLQLDSYPPQYGGGKYVYNAAQDLDSSPKGVRAEGGIIINGGYLNIQVTGRSDGSEGLESKSHTFLQGPGLWM